MMKRMKYSSSRSRIKSKSPRFRGRRLNKGNWKTLQWSLIVRWAQLLTSFTIKSNKMTSTFLNNSNHSLIPYICDRSMKVKCPFCDAVSYSIVEYKTSFLGYLVAILSILFFGFLSIILMPFLVSLTNSAIHRCAKCLNEVKSNSYFGFSSLEDKVRIVCF